MRSASNVNLKKQALIATNTRSASKTTMERKRGPDFAERSAKVVNKYAYNMPKKSMTHSKQISLKRQKFNGGVPTSIMNNSQLNSLRS